MDSFAKRYLTVISTVVALTIVSIIFTGDERVDALNEMLAADSVLAEYPYPFRVRRVENGVAVMGSPHTADVSLVHFLRTAFPALRNSGVDDPAMEAAQNTLSQTQERAEKMILGERNVTAVRWEFDERWFREQGVFLDFL